MWYRSDFWPKPAQTLLSTCHPPCTRRVIQLMLTGFVLQYQMVSTSANVPEALKKGALTPLMMTFLGVFWQRQNSLALPPRVWARSHCSSRARAARRRGVIGQAASLPARALHASFWAERS